MTLHFDNNCSRFSAMFIESAFLLFATIYKSLNHVYTLCNEQLGNCENCVKWANISHNSFSWDFYDEFFLVFCPRHAVQLYQMCLVFICSVFIKCNFFLMQMCWRCCCCCCYWRIISGYCSQFPVLCSTHIRSKSDADFYNKFYFYAISDFY